MNEKLGIFRSELDLIKDERLRNFAEKIISRLPDYFFKVPASSTGKYHPSYTLGKGGLVRHTKAAVGIAQELFNCNSIHSYNQKQKDIITISLLLHDGVKNGIEYQPYTIATHPLEMVNFIKSQQDCIDLLTNEELRVICNCIASHMGEWNKDYKTKREVLPKPQKGIEKFVHMCDYLASRKCLEYNFN